MLIAVTGGIGSGKSAVTELLKARGASIINADKINAELLTNPEYVEVLGKLFPNVVKNGAVDKKKLGGIIFNDETERKKLNALAHPLILNEIERRAGASEGLTVVEIPLLTEAGDRTRFDRIIAVSATEEVRIARIEKRDDVSEAYARAAIRAQASDRAYCEIATDVVRNNGSLAELETEVETILKSWKVRQ